MLPMLPSDLPCHLPPSSFSLLPFTQHRQTPQRAFPPHNLDREHILRATIECLALWVGVHSSELNHAIAKLSKLWRLDELRHDRQKQFMSSSRRVLGTLRPEILMPESCVWYRIDTLRSYIEPVRSRSRNKSLCLVLAVAQQSRTTFAAVLGTAV